MARCGDCSPHAMLSLKAIVAINSDMNSLERSSSACRRLMTIPGVGRLAGGLASGAVVSLLEPQEAHAQLACKSVGKDLPCFNGDCKTGETCKGPNKGPAGRCLCCGGSNITSHISILSGPPAQADVTIQDAVDGISSITLTKAVNCTVTPALPETFSPPNTSPIPLTLTKTDQTKVAQFEFEVCPPNGCCDHIDPILTVLKLTTGRWVRQTFAGVPAGSISSP